MKYKLASLFIALLLVIGVQVCQACDCPTASDVATFKFGTATQISGSTYETPLLVSVNETATFTQMRVNYDASVGTFVDAYDGGDVKNPGGIFIDSVVNGASSYVTINNSGGYGEGCDLEVFRVRFTRVGSNPVALAYHTVEGGPNSYCHLDYDSAGDHKITPTDICFETGAAKVSTVATQVSTWSSMKRLYN